LLHTRARLRAAPGRHEGATLARFLRVAMSRCVRTGANNHATGSRCRATSARLVQPVKTPAAASRRCPPTGSGGTASRPGLVAVSTSHMKETPATTAREPRQFVGTARTWRPIAGRGWANAVWVGEGRAAQSRPEDRWAACPHVEDHETRPCSRRREAIAEADRMWQRLGRPFTSVSRRRRSIGRASTRVRFPAWRCP